MLLLLPYILTGLGVSIGVCSAAGYTGALLAVMAPVLFVAGFVGGFLLFVLLLGVCALCAGPQKPRSKPDPFYAALVTYGMGLLTTACGIRLHLRGLERLPSGRFLLVSNHRSAFDPIVTGWALRRSGLVFISKPENLRIPVVGRIIHRAGFLSVDREDDRAALRTILSAAELLKSDAASVGVYPEGTRSRTADMLPFRNGVFKIAQKARVPIVAVSVRGTDAVARRFPLRAADVYLDVCGVLDVPDVMARKTQEIGEVVREWIVNSGNT